MAKKFLQVIPNPYRFLDPDGNPANAYPCDPKHAGLAAAYVGARREIHVVAPAKTFEIKKPRTAFQKAVHVVGESTPDRVKASFVFDASPVQIPDLPHYRRGIQSGDLVPADEYTARRAGVPFLPPERVLGAAKADAAKAWAREHGGELPAWAAPQTNPEPVATATS